MHEGLDIQTAALWICGLMLSVLGVMFKREVKRIDDYGERIDDIEKTVPGLVSHSQLKGTETTIINAIAELKKDIQTDLRTERERINRLAEHRP